MNPALQTLELELQPEDGPLLPQVRRALAERVGPGGEALRWAITRVAPSPTPATRGRLTLEAVVWRPSP
ncbi:MAG: hypothetical protein VKO19_00475 [Cyanobacteriota bacterium]|nr:hypothetical protein [Cyanobacteriota bacterium]